MSKHNYDENSIVTLNYRESCRQAIGMYIGGAHTGGMHHLLEEIICNAMDEAAAGYGNEVEVQINAETNQATVIDHGRGIPFRMNKQGKYAIKEMCTSLHSGGKFENAGNYKSAIGLNGVGATVTNALSSYFYILSVRNDGRCKLEFKNGEETKFEIVDENNKITGSKVIFIPDSNVFGDIKWDKNKILELLQIHAIMNEGLTFTLKWNNEVPVKYCYNNGVETYLKLKMGDNKPITNVIKHKMLVNQGQSSEAIVEIAAQYVNDEGERIYAFTNGAFNPDHGTHVTGFKSAWTTLVNNRAKELGLLNSNDENLDGGLIRKGLFLVLKLNYSSERPQFNEQQKLKLTSTSARAITSQAIGRLVLNKADAEIIVKKALIEKNAKDAAQRRRDAINKVVSGGKSINKLRDLPAKLADCNGYGGELFLTEGDSAAGSAKSCRDPKTQAIMALRGKVLNTYGMPLDEMLENEEIKGIVSALGTGIGEKFNIKNLRYDRVIMMADAK